MTSKLGTVLPRRSVAWFWFAVAALPAVYFALAAIIGGHSWVPSAIFGFIAVLIFFEPRLRKAELETVQVDEAGVLRVDGPIREHIQWGEVTEIRILTNDQGPYGEDVFFVLTGANGRGCLVPHDAAVRTKLLEELERRFSRLDDKMVVKAMGSTSNNSFLLWRREVSDAA